MANFFKRISATFRFNLRPDLTVAPAFPELLSQHESKKQGDGGVAVGSGARAIGNSVAIGPGAYAGPDCVSIGANAGGQKPLR